MFYGKLNPNYPKELGEYLIGFYDFHRMPDLNEDIYKVMVSEQKVRSIQNHFSKQTNRRNGLLERPESYNIFSQ